MTTKEMQVLLDNANETRKQIKNAIKECLLKIGKPVKFDWEENGAPSYASGAFDEDLTDAYITKIWLDKSGLILANLYAYYLGDDRKKVDLADECCVDWEDILGYLIGELDSNDEK